MESTIKKIKFSLFISLLILSIFTFNKKGQAQPPLPPDYTVSVYIVNNGPMASNVSPNPSTIIYLLQLSATGSNSVTLDQVTFKTAGTYDISDLDADSTDNIFTLYRNITPDLNNVNTSGEVIGNLGAIASGSDLIFSNLHFQFTGTIFLILTADIAPDAVNNRTIYCQGMYLNDFIFSETVTKTGAEPLTESGIQTIKNGLNVNFSYNGPVQGSINANTSNNIVYKIKIIGVESKATVNPIEIPNLTGLILTTGGTYTTSDLTSLPFKLWYSTNGALNNGFSSGATQIGGSQPAVETNNLIEFSFIQSIATTGYLYVTADISPIAISNNTITINSTPFTSFTFSNQNYALSGTDPIQTSATQTIVNVGLITAPTFLGPSSQGLINGPSNNILYKTRLVSVVNGTPPAMTGLTINTNIANTYTSDDFVAGSLKLWYSTLSTLTSGFSANATLLASADIPASGSSATFTGFSQDITSPLTCYLYITVDKAGTAQNGNSINIAALPFTNFAFSNSSYAFNGLSPLTPGALMVISENTNFVEITQIGPTEATINANTYNNIIYKLKTFSPSSFTCAVTSPCGNTSSPTAVAINTKNCPTPVITALSPTTICSGGSATLTTNASAQYTYQWRAGGVNVSGATDNSFMPTNITVTTNYSVIVSNSCGVATSGNQAITVATTAGIANNAGLSIEDNPHIPPGGSITVCAGQPGITIKSGANGTAYQWQKGGLNIEGATNSSYTLPVSGVTPNDGTASTGAYRVIVSDGCGFTGTSVTGISTMSVTIGALSALSTVYSTEGVNTICDGGSVKLNSVNFPGYSYQWRKGGNDITDATNSTYTATIPDNYTCLVIAPQCGVAVSAISTISSQGTYLPIITAMGPTTICSGDSVLLSTNFAPSFMYRWFTATTSTGTYSVIEDATGNQYMAKPTATRYYKVEVTSAFGVGTSTFATVTVPTTAAAAGSAGFYIENVPLLTLTTTTYISQSQPGIVLRSGAIGSQYIWQKGTSAISYGTNIATTTDPFIELPTNNNGTGNTGTFYYRVVVTNGCGYTGPGSSSYYSIVVYNNSTTANLAAFFKEGDLTAGGGSSVKLHAPYYPNYIYQWKKGGVNIADADSSMYEVTEDGEYQCAVQTGLFTGTATSSKQIVIPRNTHIANIRALGPLTFCNGGSVDLTTNYSPDYSYQWQIATNTTTAFFSDIGGANNFTYTAAPTATRYYRVKIFTNPLDPMEYAISNVITVTIPTTLATSANAGLMIQNNPLYSVGNTVTMTVPQYQDGITLVSGANGSAYQWYKGSATNNATSIPGATNSTYTLPSTGTALADGSTASTGYYRVVVTGACGYSGTPTTAQANATLGILVTATPTAAVAGLITEGSTDVYNGSVVKHTAFYHPNYTYQWKKGSVDIPGETNSTFTATTSDYYNCVVNTGMFAVSNSSANQAITNGAQTATITALGPTTVCSGSEVLLTTNNSTNYTYKWMEATALNGTYVDIPGANSYQCYVTPTATTYYAVEVTSSSGKAISAPITITVPTTTGLANNAGLMIQNNPLISVGNTVTITVCTNQPDITLVSGAAGTAYQWQKAGVNISGATESLYTLPANANGTGTNGAYRVIVTNGCGLTGATSTSGTLTLTINVAASPTATLMQQGSSILNPGGMTDFSVVNLPGYTYQWKQDGVDIPGATNATLSAQTNEAYINSLTLPTAGTYESSEFAPGAVKLWYNSLSTLTNGSTSFTPIGSMLLATTDLPASGDNIVFSGFSYPTGGTSYFYVTIDAPAAVTNASTINIEPMALTNVGLSGTSLITGTEPVPAAGIQTFNQGMSVALSRAAMSATTVPASTTNAIVYIVALNQSSAPVENYHLSDFTITTNGNYIVSDLVPNSFKLWYGTVSTYNNTTLPVNGTPIGTEQPIVASGGTVSWTGLDFELTGVAIRYLYVTADVSANPTNGAYIYINATPFANVNFSETIIKTGTDPIAAGALRTFSFLNSVDIKTPLTTAYTGSVKYDYTAIKLANSDNIIIYPITFNVAAPVIGSDPVLDSIKLMTKGTYIFGDLKPNSIKLWKSTASYLAHGFNPANATLIKTVDTVAADKSLIIPDINTSLPAGYNYFYITVDLSADATNGNTFYINQTLFSDYVFKEPISKTISYYTTYPFARGNTITFANRIFLNRVVPSTATGYVPASITDAILYMVSVNLTNAALQDYHLNDFTITTNGTYSSSDLVPNSFKLWYGSISTYDNLTLPVNGTLLGSPQPIVDAGGTVSWTGLNATLAASGIRYLYVTADISDNPLDGAYINVNATPFNDIIFTEASIKVGTDPILEGDHRIFVNSNSVDFRTPLLVSPPAVNKYNYTATKNANSSNIILFPLTLTVNKLPAAADPILDVISLPAKGTYVNTDFVPNSIKLWKSTASYLAHSFNLVNATLITTVDIVPTNNMLVISGINNALANGAHYFYITGDIASGANDGNTFYIGQTDFSNFEFTETVNKTVTAPTTYPFVTGDVITFANCVWKSDALTSNWHSTNNWTNAIVPNNLLSAKIQAGLHQPIISTGSFNTYNITLNSNSTLTIAPNSATVTLNVTNELIIKNGASVFVNPGTGQAVNVTVNNLIIEAGGTLTIANGSNITFTITGNISNAGTLTATTGKIIFGGSAQQNINGATTFHSITINNASGVVINDPCSFTGLLTLQNGELTTNDKLTLISDATQTGCISGSGSGTITGKVTVQRYNNGVEGYHYISAPTANTTFSQIIDDMAGNVIYPQEYETYTTGPISHLWEYDETNVSQTLHPTTGYTEDQQLMMNGWRSPDPTSAMVPMKGYSANIPAGSGLEVTETVNNGPYSLAVTYTSSGNDNIDGWNLMGNPYPSPIDWDAAGWTKTNVNDAIYFFVPTSKYAGQHQSYNAGVGNPGTVTSIIPMFQAFWVKTTDNGTLGVTNAVRVDNTDPTFYKKNNKSEEKQLLRLKGYSLANTNLTDGTVIYFSDGPTRGFDGNYDAYKLMNNDGSPNLYSIAEGSKLSINALPELGEDPEDVVLEFDVSTEGEYQLDATEFNNFPATTEIYLEDKALSTLQDLRVNSSYTFTIKPNDSKSRFVIHFKPEITDVEKVQNTEYLKAYTFGKNLVLSFNTSQSKAKADINIYNIFGQKVISDKTIGIGTHNIQLNLATGFYYVRMTYNNRTVAQKVFIE